MTAPEVVCEDCHRPLTDRASVARGRGPICQAVLEGDTHISPKPRRPPRRPDPGQIPLPLEAPVDVETRKTAIDAVARHVLAHELERSVAICDLDWGDYGDLDESDWNAVLDRIKAIAQSVRPSDEKYQAAYEHLTGASTVQEGQKR